MYLNSPCCLKSYFMQGSKESVKVLETHPTIVLKFNNLQRNPPKGLCLRYMGTSGPVMLIEDATEQFFIVDSFTRCLCILLYQ